MPDASDTTYAPGDPTDWDSPPGIVDRALDELASRQQSDVDGPASSTDNAIARWDGTGGDTLQNSAPTINDAGTIGCDRFAALGGGDIEIADNISMDAGTTLAVDTILEETSAAGVSIDSVVLKDGSIPTVTDITMSGNLNSRDPDNFVFHGSTSTDNAIARFDGTGGKTVQNSAVTISDTGTISGTNISITGSLSATTSVITDVVAEKTAGNGVDVDGVLCKDGQIEKAAMACETFMGYDATGGQALSTTEAVVNIDTETINTGSIFTLATDEVDVSVTGKYLVTWNVSCSGSGSSDMQWRSWIEVNGTEVTGTGVRAYMTRSASQMSNCGGSAVVSIGTAGHNIRIKMDRLSGTANGATIANHSQLSIVGPLQD